MLIAKSAEAQIYTSREEPDEQVEIEEVRGPCCGLMFGDGSDDGNMDLCVSRVPQRVESSSPRGNDTRDSQEDESAERYDEDEEDEAAEERLELSAWELLSNILNESDNLDETKDTWQKVRQLEKCPG
jgi:hypothetical protein